MKLSMPSAVAPVGDGGDEDGCEGEGEDADEVGDDGPPPPVAVLGVSSPPPASAAQATSPTTSSTASATSAGTRAPRWRGAGATCGFGGAGSTWVRVGSAA